jgi:hypothetical protein
MASIVEICNGALNQLGATTILSLTEDSKNARLCNQRFTQVRDAVFRSHPWNCLQKRQELAADTTAPAWGFKFAYTLPADCLRLLRILDYDSNYKVEGRKISAALGADIAFAVTSNNQTATNMYNLFQDKLKDARFVDSTEGQNIDQDLGMSDQIDASTFIKSRF